MSDLRRLTLLLTGGVLLLDAVTKWLARTYTVDRDLFPFFSLRVFENTRGPFHIGSRSVVIGLSCVVLAFLFSRLRRANNREEAAAWSLLLGGGLANILERLVAGRVTDIFVIGTSAWNVADVMVLLGIALLLRHWRHRRRTLAVLPTEK